MYYIKYMIYTMRTILSYKKIIDLFRSSLLKSTHFAGVALLQPKVRSYGGRTS